MHTQNYQLVSLTEDDVPGAKLPRDITDCNVFELKRWLECHGQKKGGKKADLQERVSQCIGLGLKIDPKVDGGKWHRIKAEKQSKTINLSPSSRDVDKLANFPDTGWKTFPSMNIPAMFNYGHIYHYLVESVAQLCANDEEEREMNIEDSVTEKPLRKGRSLVTSGFVENIQDTTNEIVKQMNLVDVAMCLPYCCLSAIIWESMDMMQLHHPLQKIASGTKDGYKQRLLNWLENKFWFKKSLTTPDMLYGIEEEPKAIALYEKCRNATVNESGLWVHADFPYLGASPDGLIFVDGKLDGIVEVKCLKILKTRTVKQLLDAASTELKTTIN
ncbi:predicted protein [Nematostella vectensis]|uniref:YqaJ viral recombinase domain-containing protein n=1 Tax=Nematostella vectensis TaxID=45351 RepID=A7SPC6_NEMVE|nr:predicted protein [Nematostella vectensis]|eukprot:XP_001626513.1 predicted protein [Nematostella vectensis]